MFTERHGMRSPVERTSTITADMYALLFDACVKHYRNLSWRFPEQCPDGHGCCGVDGEALERDLKFTIPSLYRNSSGKIDKPRYSLWDEDVQFDQYALLDFVEYIGQRCRDIEELDYHKFFMHHHLALLQTDAIFKYFQHEINSIFYKTGLLFELTDTKTIERVTEDGIINSEIKNAIHLFKEQGVKELLEESILLFKQPRPISRGHAVEKMWDAFERIKTFHTTLDKKSSSQKIIHDISSGNSKFIELFEKEFEELTKIGNNFRIRHHETNKIDIIDERHYDYFFNRCLSLMSLAIRYLS